MKSGLKFVLSFFVLLSLSCPDIFSRNSLTVCPNGCDFEFIQDAIDAADPGDIIIVEAGVYEENLIISKPIILSGANAGISAGINSGIREEESIIKPGEGIGVLICDFTSGTLIIDGFKLSGESSWTEGGIVRSAIGEPGTNVQIINNIIICPNTAINAAKAIQTTGFGTEISRNLVDASNINLANWAGSAIEVTGNADNIIIENNIVSGADQNDHGININLGFNEMMNNINILNNNLTYCYFGIRVFPGVGDSEINNIIIKENYISICEEGIYCDGGYFPLGEIEGLQIIKKNEIYLCSYGLHLASSNWEVTNNLITNNDIGIFIYQANDLEINNNIIMGNTTYGIQLNGSATVNATCNWWGTVDEIEIEGYVSSGISFIPFLVSDNIAEALCIGGSPVFIWQGLENNCWTNPQNWSEESSAGENDIVKIPPENEYLHPLIIETNATCYLMEISYDASVTINSGGSLSIESNMTNDGALIICSDENGDGSLIVNGELHGSGNYTVERYLKYPGNYANPPGGRYHLVSSPVTSVAAWTVFAGLYLFPHNEAVFDWGTPIENPYYNIKPGKGYLLWTGNETTRTFSGKVNHGDIGPLELQRTYELPEDEQGWNLIGNPYPSVIDWDAETGWNKENVENAVYVWNNDQYAAYINGLGTNEGSNFIAHGQGFFVRVSNGFQNGSVSMNNQVRTNNPASFKNYGNQPESISIKITGNNSSDETVIYYVQAAQETFDEKYDASKLFGAEHAPQLFTIKDESKLAIHAINNQNNIPGKKVYLKVGNETEYSIKFSNNLCGQDNIFLKDLFTNETFAAGENYSFTADPEDINERFQFVSSPAQIKELKKTNIEVWVYNRLLYVNVPTEQTLIEITIYNIPGSAVMSSQSFTTDLSLLKSGVYIAEVKTCKQIKVKKIIIK